MPFNFTRIRTLLMDVPRHGKLAYCLLRDNRVPRAPKAALLGALGLIVSPIDLPAWIPVVGELDVLALGILSVKVFVDACPQELVQEHEQALARGDSSFDRDLRKATGTVRGVAGAAARKSALRVVQRWGNKTGAPIRPRVLEDETA